MKMLTIKKGVKQYNVPLNNIMQWCGHNVIVKNELIDDIAKYFSTAKYMEHEQDMTDNILIDDEKVGRKHFQTYMIEDRNSLIQLIKMSKSSLVIKNIKKGLDTSLCQKELNVIDECLTRIYAGINGTVMDSLGSICVDYDRNELMDIIQQCHIVTNTGEPIERLGNMELVDIFLGAIGNLQKSEPESVMVLFKNIDHLLSAEEYKRLVQRCVETGSESDIYFIMSTSLPGYIVINSVICESIAVFNTICYVMPDYNHIKEFIEDNYPYYRTFEDDVLIGELSESIHSIGGEYPIAKLESYIIIKMINSTLCIDSRLQAVNNSLLMNYLNA